MIKNRKRNYHLQFIATGPYTYKDLKQHQTVVVEVHKRWASI
jgi:hypothetical protein